MATKIFVRERRKVEKGEKKPRFRGVGVSGGGARGAPPAEQLAAVMTCPGSAGQPCSQVTVWRFIQRSGIIVSAFPNRTAVSMPNRKMPSGFGDGPTRAWSMLPGMLQFLAMAAPKWL